MNDNYEKDMPFPHFASALSFGFPHLCIALPASMDGKLSLIRQPVIKERTSL